MPHIERFAVGSIECQIVADGVAMYETADLAAGVRHVGAQVPAAS